MVVIIRFCHLKMFLIIRFCHLKMFVVNVYFVIIVHFRQIKAFPKWRYLLKTAMRGAKVNELLLLRGEFWLKPLVVSAPATTTGGRLKASNSSCIKYKRQALIKFNEKNKTTRPETLFNMNKNKLFYLAILASSPKPLSTMTAWFLSFRNLFFVRGHP